MKCAATGVGLLLIVVGLAPAGPAPDARDTIARGREIFVREWVPGDRTPHGGDGLGPVYNDSSCVACQSLGGPGGAGPANKNAEILTAIPNLLTKVLGSAILRSDGVGNVAILRGATGPGWSRTTSLS
jgi:hypothetical protein